MTNIDKRIFVYNKLRELLGPELVKQLEDNTHKSLKEQEDKIKLELSIKYRDMNKNIKR